MTGQARAVRASRKAATAAVTAAAVEPLVARGRGRARGRAAATAAAKGAAAAATAAAILATSAFRYGATYTPVHTIGIYQPGGVQYKTLNGLLPGFTIGQQATGQMKPAIDAYEAQVALTNIEAIGAGLPNQMGAPSLSYLQGETRFIVFAAPMVPHATHTGDEVGSLTKLLQGGYDSKIQATVAALITAGLTGPGLEGRICLRVGWEFNAGVGKSGNTGFEWATNYVDPLTGNVNGIAQYKLAAAHWETVARAAGYTGFIEWNGGNNDTSALPVSSAMPTHGDPSNTLWGWDVYAGNIYNNPKNAPQAAIDALTPIYNGYVAYCRSHGYMFGHGEYGCTYKANSPYTLNDNSYFYSWFFQIIAANADVVAYAMHYQQNQDYTYVSGTPLTESHQIAFSVSTSGGAPLGVASSSAYTGAYPVGGTSVNDTTAPANTVSTMGSLHNSNEGSGLFWVLTTDPNKVLARDSWLAYFGGANGLGAPAMVQPAVAPPEVTTSPTALDSPTFMTVVYG